MISNENVVIYEVADLHELYSIDIKFFLIWLDLENCEFYFVVPILEVGQIANCI